MMPQMVILAGGMATRLYPVTKTIPKAMLDINGEPFIAHQLRLIKKKGISDVLICAGYLGEQIKDYVKEGQTFNLNVQYSFDGEKLLGTAGALRKAVHYLADDFYIMYGDSYLDVDYEDIYRVYGESNKDGIMTIIENRNMWDKSNVLYEEGKIVLYDKKQHNDKMHFVDYGLSILKNEEIRKLPENDISDLSEVFKKMVQEQRMAAYIETKRFYEIGSVAGIEETKQYIKTGGNPWN